MQAAIVERQAVGPRGTLAAAILRRLPLFSALVAAGMLALAVAILADGRRDAWLQAAQDANNLSIVMEREIGRSIAAYDLSITGAVKVLQIPGLAQASPALRQAALFDRAITAEYLGSLVVVNAAGDIVADSAAYPPHKLNLADREHFFIQRDHPDVGLYISRPLTNRMANNDPIVVLSRRVNDAEGRFAGTVTGGLRLAYFNDLFAQLNFGSSGSVTLLRADGRVIARYPHAAQDIDRDLSQSQAFRVIASAPSGQFEGSSVIDGDRRLYTFRHIGALPLVLTIAITVDEIYAAWWRKALVIGVVVTALAGATVALGQLCRLEMRRRIAVEGSLVEVAEELSTLATTDGLTELDNRRTFDSKLDREWRRAARSASLLALLMIDVDRFKLYNDSYGHPAGDAVLRAVALCVRQNIRSSGDSAARYGGEEFVVLLPDTDASGAVLVAERISAALAALDLAHGGSECGRVTASMGLATCRPTGADGAAALLKAADLALFKAKQTGRNRLCVAARTSSVLVS